ncbi:MAG: serine hydrolase domain-containing protein [Candidatus Acidiferrales bacterium]
MSRAVGWLALVVSLFVATAVAYAADETIPARVDQVFAQWNLATSPGCALVVVKDGRIVYERGYGMANLELGVPITPQTVFDIGSVSKQFTAMSIVLLEQDGKLEFDDDIRKYLPEIPDYGSKITVRHLLHHTSGLRNYTDLFDLAGVPEIDLTTDRDALELIARQETLNFKPGEQFLYSDTNFFLMSLIVKRVTGKSLRQFAQERIFGPLGMTSTHFHDDHTMIVPHRATGYAPHAAGGFEIDMSNFQQLGDGSVMTTVEDLYKWDQNFYHSLVGGPDAIRLLTTPGTLNNGRRSPYGMGLFIDRYHGLNWIHHSGEWVGYRAGLSRFPDQKLSVLLTCNCVGSMRPMEMAARIADIYLAEELPQGELGAARAQTAESAGPSSPPAALLVQYVGAYWSRNSGAFLRFSLKGDKLVISAPEMGQALAQVGDGQFESSDSDSENKVSYVFRRAGRAAPWRLEASENGTMTVFEAVKDPDLLPARLADYQGTYSNRELRCTWELLVENGQLIRRQWMNEDQQLDPIFADGFVGDLSEGQFILHFNRQQNKGVTSFDVATDMVRPMRFEKVPNNGSAIPRNRPRH